MSVNEHPWRIPTWYPQIPKNKLDTLQAFFNLLVESNKTSDLVSPRTIPFADLLHFADSIQASQMIMGNSSISSLHDFGSGAGFPGIVFAILYPEVQVNLVERDPRKASFLSSAISQLSLSNASVIADSVEKLPEGSVTVAIARGFGPIAKVLLSTRKLFPVGGRLFHLKGEEWPTELSQIPSQLCVQWKPSHIGSYDLPAGEVSFAVVKTERVRE